MFIVCIRRQFVFRVIEFWRFNCDWWRSMNDFVSKLVGNCFRSQTIKWCLVSSSSWDRFAGLTCSWPMSCCWRPVSGTRGRTGVASWESLADENELRKTPFQSHQSGDMFSSLKFSTLRTRARNKEPHENGNNQANEYDDNDDADVSCASSLRCQQPFNKCKYLYFKCSQGEIKWRIRVRKFSYVEAEPHPICGNWIQRWGFDFRIIHPAGS